MEGKSARNSCACHKPKWKSLHFYSHPYPGRRAVCFLLHVPLFLCPSLYGYGVLWRVSCRLTQSPSCSDSPHTSCNTVQTNTIKLNWTHPTSQSCEVSWDLNLSKHLGYSFKTGTQFQLFYTDFDKPEQFHARLNGGQMQNLSSCPNTPVSIRTTKCQGALHSPPRKWELCMRYESHKKENKTDFGRNDCKQNIFFSNWFMMGNANSLPSSFWQFFKAVCFF